MVEGHTLGQVTLDPGASRLLGGDTGGAMGELAAPSHTEWSRSGGTTAHRGFNIRARLVRLEVAPSAPSPMGNPVGHPMS